MIRKVWIVISLVPIALSLTPTPPGPEPQGRGLAFNQAFNLPESIKRGKDLYAAECMSCHMENGEGLPGVYPPVAKTDYLKKPSAHLIDIILKGQDGEIVVNGVTYNTPMPAQAYLDDEKTSDILNYIRNSWGNKGAAITPTEVKKQRAKIK
jgi:nitrite reductase (NO-forming)